MDNSNKTLRDLVRELTFEELLRMILITKDDVRLKLSIDRSVEICDMQTELDNKKCEYCDRRDDLYDCYKCSAHMCGKHVIISDANDYCCHEHEWKGDRSDDHSDEWNF